MSTPVDVSSTAAKSKSRRALLAGALGGLGAWAASAVGRAAPVRAMDGDQVEVGGEYTASSVTKITNADGPAIWGASTMGNGLYGSSDTSAGVYGSSGSHIGVQGYGDTGRGIYGSSSGSFGVHGVSTSPAHAGSVGHGFADGTGVLGLSGTADVNSKPKAKTGMYGEATQDSGSRGVWGRSNAGQGVRGQATSGVGLFGKATTGFALRTSGRLKADKVSGVATISAGSTGVTVTPGVDVTSGSFVLLTPRANIGSRGLWYVPNATANTFRIRMSSSRSSNTKVAWLLLG